MNFTLAILDLAGLVALLLWGVRMVRTGVQRAFGARLRLILSHALGSRIRSLAAGIGVTAVLQSSTATGLMVTGFVAAGLIDLVPALAVMLGANIGTTLIVQVFAFNVAVAAPVLVLLGFVMFQRGTATIRDSGRVLIGLGLMLIALHDLLALITPYESARDLQTLLAMISGQPVLDVIVAAVLTWATHSSVAIVLLIMSLASRHVVPAAAALALVLGANLGTAINPCLEGTSDPDPAARRLPVGNLVNRLAGVIIGLIALGFLTKADFSLTADPARAVADFHTLFNLALAILFFPILPGFARLLERWMPARINSADPGRPLYLEPTVRKAPVVALGDATREALRLADIVESMLRDLRAALAKPDRHKIAETQQRVYPLGQLNGAIKVYLTTLDTAALTPADSRRLNEILMFGLNMEHAGDRLCQNLLGHVSRKLKQGLAFSPEGGAELLSIVDRLMINLRAAASLFVSGDIRAARLLASEKETFREIAANLTAAHFDRLRGGRIETTETSALHLDILRDLVQMNSHFVTAAAYPVLESAGELLPSRLKQIEDREEANLGPCQVD